MFFIVSSLLFLAPETLTYSQDLMTKKYEEGDLSSKDLIESVKNGSGNSNRCFPPGSTDK